MKVENRLGSRRRGGLGRTKEVRKEECRHVGRKEIYCKQLRGSVYTLGMG